MNLSPETDEITAFNAPQVIHSRRFHWLYVLWALPVSLCALPLLPLAIWRAQWRVQGGALEVVSPALTWFLHGRWFRALAGADGFAAATIGHVIIARSATAMSACRLHEHTHVRQAERWGPLFPVAYVFAGLVAAAKARQWSAYYASNPFEIEAYEAERRCRDYD